MVDTTLLIVALAGLCAGLVQGIAGFAFALVATPILVWVLAPEVLVPVTVLAAFAAQSTSLLTNRGHFDWRVAWPFLVGGVAGVPVGVSLLPLIDIALFRLWVGIGLVGYSALMLACKTFPTVRWGGRLADGAVGVVAGIMGGVSTLSGPPLTLWCALREWPKETQRATFQSFFVTTQVTMMISFVRQDLLTPRVWLLVAIMAPLAVLASQIGGHLFRRFSDLAFRKMVFVLLLVSGLALVAPTLRALLAGQ